MQKRRIISTGTESCVEEYCHLDPVFSKSNEWEILSENVKDPLLRITAMCTNSVDLLILGTDRGDVLLYSLSPILLYLSKVPFGVSQSGDDESNSAYVLDLRCTYAATVKDQKMIVLYLLGEKFTRSRVSLYDLGSMNIVFDYVGECPFVAISSVDQQLIGLQYDGDLFFFYEETKVKKSKASQVRDVKIRRRNAFLDVEGLHLGTFRGEQEYVYYTVRSGMLCCYDIKRRRVAQEYQYGSSISHMHFLDSYCGSGPVIILTGMRGIKVIAKESFDLMLVFGEKNQYWGPVSVQELDEEQFILSTPFWRKNIELYSQRIFRWSKDGNAEIFDLPEGEAFALLEVVKSPSSVFGVSPSGILFYTREQMRSSWPGAMYPLGFIKVEHNVEYIEAEDETDNVVIPGPRKAPVKKRRGCGIDTNPYIRIEEDVEVVSSADEAIEVDITKGSENFQNLSTIQLDFDAQDTLGAQVVADVDDVSTMKAAIAENYETFFQTPNSIVDGSFMKVYEDIQNESKSRTEMLKSQSSTSGS